MSEPADEVATAAVLAAQANDLATRPSGRNWSRVPDDQVARLLVGADQIMGVTYRARINHLATELAAADETSERAKARVRELQAALADALSRFTKTDAGYRARISGTDLARLRAIADGRPGND